MGLFVTDQGNRSELQEKLAAELRAKLASQSKDVDIDPPEIPDGVKDSAYVKDFEKKSGSNGRMTALIIIGVVIMALAILVFIAS
ncbi:MAG: hypothetical protein LBL08_03685 [Candidatus Nomurabacteria bacterium]|nr:hypothetical protein [Candidatus Nomurabacteria bacterium]